MINAETEPLGGYRRRRARGAGLPGRHAAHDPDLHVHAGPDPGPGRGRPLSAADLPDPEAAAAGQPAGQAAHPAGPPQRRADQRDRAGRARHPRQRHGPARARPVQRAAGHGVLDPLRHLQKEIPDQVPQQLHRPARALLLLLDRRLSRHPGPDHHRRAGRRGRRAEGPGLALARAPDLLSDDVRREDQVRAGRRAVRCRRACATRPSSRTSRRRHPTSRGRSGWSTSRWPTTRARSSWMA